ncbi:MAG: hypothetical protein JSV62_11050 [Promethearchaeota archaeon]|nr:MAG: hypothetical protein JSV62_11050 [Candidatus Lokiarchaeota archaeon]
MRRRLFTPNRWNWSQKAEKWVYVKINKDGKRFYKYQLEPPQEFIELTNKMKILNEKLLETTDPEENAKIFNELIKVSQKMQDMGKVG